MDPAPEPVLDPDPSVMVSPAPRLPAPGDHDARVGRIAATVRALAAAGSPVHIDKGGVHHVVPIPKDRRFPGRAVDVSSLDRILSIDVDARVCRAEPGVTFGRLVRATLRYGLLPAVVPELEGITVGGAVAGCSVESTSFREGGFHDTCLEYELVTGTGEVLTCSPDRDPFLFEMIHGSYGTLGILTELTFRLVPAKPFVHMAYRRYPDAERFHQAVLNRCAAGDVDFIDGIVHGPGAFVLCLGRFVDRAPETSSYRWLHIYYRSTLARREDHLTTVDYCFRYDTEAHWLTRTVPPLTWKPVRFLVGKAFLGSTNLITWSKRIERILALKRRPDVVVDVFIPSRRSVEFLHWYAQELAFYPLWVVPYRIPAPYPWIAPGHAARFGDDLFMDLAVYGMPNRRPDVDLSKVLEDKTYELGGIKTLISRNHYTQERFWTIHDREHHRAAKARLDPHGLFPGLYEKLHRVE